MAAVLTQVTFEIATLHAAATNRRCSRLLPVRRPESSSSGVSTVRNASSTFSRASPRVRPWLRAPGTSSTRATIQPSVGLFERDRKVDRGQHDHRITSGTRDSGA